MLAIGSVFQTHASRVAKRGANRRLAAALGTGLTATTVTCPLGYAMILKGSKLDPGLRMRGQNRIGVAFDQLPDADESFLVVTGGRTYASELTFYMPQHPKAFVWNPTGAIVSQYDVWGGPRRPAG